MELMPLSMAEECRAVIPYRPMKKVGKRWGHLPYCRGGSKQGSWDSNPYLCEPKSHALTFWRHPIKNTVGKDLHLT